MRVIFATSIPFMRQHEIDMYIHDVEKVYQIEKWDLSPLYHYEDESKVDLIDDQIKIYSLDELSDQIGDSEKVLFITSIVLADMNKINSVLSRKKNVVTLYISKEILNSWIARKANLLIPGIPLKKRIKGLLMLNPISARAIERVRYGSFKYDYIFSSCNLAPQMTRKFKKIHDIKYDEYLRAKNSENPIGEKYILFVDTGLRTHPDYRNMANNVDPYYYKKTLCAYFEQLEERYGMPVIISGHPKVEYQEDDYDGRKIIQGKTPELIEHCEFILAHFSTSLNQAVLAQKPVEILTSKKIQSSSNGEVTNLGLYMAKLLGFDVVNIDHPTMKTPQCDRILYRKFINKYLIDSNNADKTNGEILVEFINELK